MIGNITKMTRNNMQETSAPRQLDTSRETLFTVTTKADMGKSKRSNAKSQNTRGKHTSEDSRTAIVDTVLRLLVYTMNASILE